MKITAEQWSLVSGLLDEAIELPGEQRAAWLESLDGLDDNLKAELRSFLERHARIESSDFLGSLPALGGLGHASQQAGLSVPLAPGMVIGPYTIEREIGRGGMGAVWLAQRADGLLKRPVALKLLRPGLHGEELLTR